MQLCTVTSQGSRQVQGKPYRAFCGPAWLTSRQHHQTAKRNVTVSTDTGVTKRTDDKKAVLITGCSSGVGFQTAVLMASRGWRVYAGVRTLSQAAVLDAVGNPNITPIRLDVTSEADITTAVQRIARECNGLDGFVQNAGAALMGPIEYAEIEEWRRTIEVNLVSTVRLTQLLLPLLRQGESPGRIVLVGSAAGTIATSFGSAYFASKHGMEALTDSLRQEVKHFGIDVSLVKPMSLKTQIWGKGLAALAERQKRWPADWEQQYPAMGPFVNQYVEEAMSAVTTAEDVAAAVYDGLTAQRTRTRYFLPWFTVFMKLRHALTDRFFDLVVSKILGTKGMSVNEAMRIVESDPQTTTESNPAVKDPVKVAAAVSGEANEPGLRQ